MYNIFICMEKFIYVFILSVWVICGYKYWCFTLSFFSYLHSCDPPIIHGNLTCDTIFIQHNGLIKIGSGLTVVKMIWLLIISNICFKKMLMSLLSFTVWHRLFVNGESTPSSICHVHRNVVISSERKHRPFLFLPSLNNALRILAENPGSYVMYCNISCQLWQSKTYIKKIRPSSPFRVFILDSSSCTRDFIYVYWLKFFHPYKVINRVWL